MLVILVRVSISVTVAPTAADPLESVIVPSREPLTACPLTTVKAPAQTNASDNSLFVICIDSLLIECNYYSTHCGVSSDFSPSLVTDCFQLAKVSLDARRQLCLSERRRAFQRVTQILNPFLFLPGPRICRSERI